MIIPCVTPGCNTIVSVKNSILKEHIARGLKPIVRCKKCHIKMEVKPLMAVCKNPACRKTFHYYDFVLKAENPMVNCPHCKKLNKVVINKNTNLVLKEEN